MTPSPFPLLKVTLWSDSPLLTLRLAPDLCLTGAPGLGGAFLSFYSLTGVPAGCGPLSWKWQGSLLTAEFQERELSVVWLSACRGEGGGHSTFLWLRVFSSLSLPESQNTWPLKILLSFSKILFHMPCLSSGRNFEHLLTHRSRERLSQPRLCILGWAQLLPAEGSVGRRVSVVRSSAFKSGRLLLFATVCVANWASAGTVGAWVGLHCVWLHLFRREGKSRRGCGPGFPDAVPPLFPELSSNQRSRDVWSHLERNY